MLFLNCPWCGPRDETEYHYGGQAHLPYPKNPDELDDRQWAEYVFYRDNPKGPFAERWVHSTGCRRWFNVVRDTVTYEVVAVYRLTEPRPELPPQQTTDPVGGNR
ncbi:sarcosine oxidase subunit delta [Actinomadura geliboluensis]|uniref:Sarcosine oxidase subunit delta family protein n=1 Tax=Actinomadura geliboluensis TaxID=882440 RepID=A0A5S4GWU9_9ACTN|nr:sarcosine oxidase subunit delta [Actinomadura geliboluensis]TMR37386.1 sarcosine oxidase subunit delta family protein [Actinomadura geliboluensis]